MQAKSVVTGLTLLFSAGTAAAQLPNPYGAPIGLDDAKKVAAPAVAEARKNNWNVAVAIVDIGGNLVYYEKMDGTQLGSPGNPLPDDRRSEPSPVTAAVL